MHLTVTLTGNTSVLESEDFPPIKLQSEYELTLLDFEMYNSLLHVIYSNNSFYYRDPEMSLAEDLANQRFSRIVIPTGSFEISDTETYLRWQLDLRKLLSTHPYYIDENMILGGPEVLQSEPITLRTNHMTPKCQTFSRYKLDFSPPNSIGQLLGCESTVYDWFEWHESTLPVNIMKINTLGVECSITHSAYNIGKSVHNIHEFSPQVPPGYEILVIPRNLIYFPVLA